MESDLFDPEAYELKALLHHAGASARVFESDKNGGSEEGLREVANNATESADVSPLTIAPLSDERRFYGTRKFKRHVAQCSCDSPCAFDGDLEIALSLAAISDTECHYVVRCLFMTSSAPQEASKKLFQWYGKKG